MTVEQEIEAIDVAAVITAASRNDVIERVAFDYREDRYVAVRFKRGQLELYRVEPGGLEMFVHYAEPPSCALDRLALSLVPR